jgi:hypothetical protein
MEDKRSGNTRPGKRRWIIFLAVLGVVCLVGVLLVKSWSAIGASLAGPMRNVLGIQRVAQLETLLFNAQDGVKRLQYRLGMAQPEIPFQEVAILPTTQPPTAIPATETVTPVNEEMAANEADSSPDQVEETLTPVPSPTPSAWTLENIIPYGNLLEEGAWKPYIFNSAGEVVALRTFLQPDPERPFTIVAVTAFDLSKSDLYFVLGLEEPAKPGGPHGYGRIPDEDLQPGKLLAAFNGGFIAEHGAYGAMADGVTALAGRAGLATLGIFQDGRVRIGEWKNDLLAEEKYRAWRQNALMIIHNGEINPKVETGTYIEWGANLDGSVVTMRSAVGLSEDNQVLYYFAGPSLSMPVLADAMQRTGVDDGMLLDINPTHAHFTAFRVQDGQLTAEPLFAEEMDIWVDRYLHPWKQDFFYLTEK